MFTFTGFLLLRFGVFWLIGFGDGGFALCFVLRLTCCGLF